MRGLWSRFLPLLTALVAVTAVTAVTVMFIAQSPFADASTAGLKRVHDPRRMTYSIHLKSCHARDTGKLPDPACTPGSIDPAVTQKDIRSTICKAGWTATVRPPESQTEYAKATRTSTCTPTRAARYG